MKFFSFDFTKVKWHEPDWRKTRPILTALAFDHTDHKNAHLCLLLVLGEHMTCSHGKLSTEGTAWGQYTAFQYVN